MHDGRFTSPDIGSGALIGMQVNKIVGNKAEKVKVTGGVRKVKKWPF